MHNLLKLLRYNDGVIRRTYKIRSWQRLKLKVDVDTSNTSKTLDVKAAKNREIWEKQNSTSSLLIGKVSLDDVFFMNEFAPIKHLLTDAILYHKEYCLDSSMLNAPYAILKANFVLNMKTKKVTKFIHKIGGVAVLPFELSFINKRKILAFCKTAEDITIALEAGAMHAGDESLVKMLEQGLIHYEEFDQAVCHPDALHLVSKLRPILKDKLPVKQTPRVGTDIKVLVDSFVHGYEYESRKIEGINEEAYLTVPLGEISWPAGSLEKNFLTFASSILNGSSSQIAGDVFVRTTLTCPPSDETFVLDISEHAQLLKKDRTKSRVSVVEEEEETAEA